MDKKAGSRREGAPEQVLPPALNWAKETKVSYWTRFDDGKSVVRSVAAVARRIQDGGQNPEPGAGLRPREERVDRMPLVTFAGTFGPRRSAGKFQEHSGLVSVDFELLRERRTNPERWKRKAVRSLPSVAMAFTTPSKNGVRLVFRVQPVPRNPGEHALAFRAICRDLKQAGMEGWTPTGADVRTPAFLPTDPRLYLAPKPEPVRWKDNRESLNPEP